MAEPTPPPKPAAPAQPGPHDRRALLDAYQNLVRSEQEKQAAGPTPPDAAPPRAFFWLSTLTAIVALSALLLLRPAWLFTTPPAESTALMEASLRVQIFVEIERIERFRSDSGRVPGSAAEAGIPVGAPVSYSSDGVSYSLSGRNGPVALTYSSGTPPAQFLGNSYQVIRARGTP